jgi:hypothetical protein
MKKIFVSLMLLAIVLVPTLSFAQIIGVNANTCKSFSQDITLGTGNQAVTTTGIAAISKIAVWINLIIPIVIGLATLIFIWGVVQYVIAKEEEAKTEGRDKMIYGLIGLAVIVSVWGLVAVLKNSFGISNTASIQVPCIPGSC